MSSQRLHFVLRVAIQVSFSGLGGRASGFSWEIKTTLSHGRLEEHPCFTWLVRVLVLNLNKDGLCYFHGWKKKK